MCLLENMLSDDDNKCPICLEVFGEFQVVEFQGGEDPCKHRFCFPCMLRHAWSCRYTQDELNTQDELKIEYSIKCPICRKLYKGTSFTDFFYIYPSDTVPSCEES